MSDWTEWIHDLRRKVQRLQKKVSDAELELDCVASDLGVMAEQVVGRPQPVPLPRRRRSQSENAALQRLARIGVDSLAIERRSDDSADVVVNGTVRLTLSPKLADLLVLLAAPTAQPEDGLVGWKTFDWIVAGLSAAARRPTERRNLAQLISRLRNVLEGADLNRFFVQVSRPKKSARFALKAQAVDVIEGE